jgi:hypothetical protein
MVMVFQRAVYNILRRWVKEMAVKKIACVKGTEWNADV